MTVDERCIFFERTFLLPSIRVISLSYSVSTTNFYDIVIPCELLSDSYDREIETRNAFKRLTSIVQKLSLCKEKKKDRVTGRSKKEVLFVSTVFSRELPALMVSEYNSFAKQYGMAQIPWEIQKMFAVRKNGSLIDGKKETAFAFPEAIALAALYLSHYRRAVAKLNEHIKTENERKRARQRYRKVKSTFDSKELRDGFSKLLVDLSCMWCEDAYRAERFEYTREFRLPKRFSCSKDIRYAISKHYLAKEAIDQSGWDEKKEKRYKIQDEELENVKWYTDRICPLMKAVLTGRLPDDSQDISTIDLSSFPEADAGVSSDDYVIACKLAVIVKDFIQRASDSAKFLLSYLKEADELSNKPFLEYFNKLQ